MCVCPMSGGGGCGSADGVIPAIIGGGLSSPCPGFGPCPAPTTGPSVTTGCAGC